MDWMILKILLKFSVVTGVIWSVDFFDIIILSWLIMNFLGSTFGGNVKRL